MSASLVMSITDELVAELEALATRNHAYVPVKPDVMKALMTERAELKRDAERYRWLRDRCFGFSHDEAERGISTSRWGEWNYDTPQGHCAQMDAAIDAAMQSEADK